MKQPYGDKKYLLKVGDGPEGIEIYTSEERGVVDWSPAFPALYIDISLQDTCCHFGPFQLGSIYRQIKDRLKDETA